MDKEKLLNRMGYPGQAGKLGETLSVLEQRITALELEKRVEEAEAAAQAVSEQYAATEERIRTLEEQAKAAESAEADRAEKLAAAEERISALETEKERLSRQMSEETTQRTDADAQATERIVVLESARTALEARVSTVERTTEPMAEGGGT